MSGDPPQNIYDDPRFFAGYSELDRFGAGWSRAFEWPAFSSLLPPLRGLRVLDLGCGTGGLAHHMAAEGAAEVQGIDISERMLAVARHQARHPQVSFRRAAIEEASFAAGRFDLIVSSLALHYVADYPGLISRVAGWLAADGLLIYSVEHPVYLSRGTTLGWVRDDAGQPGYWALDRYGEEGERVEDWIVDGVRKHHRMISTLVGGVLDAGLILERLIEPMPTPELLALRPDWIHERRRPFCLLLRARNPRQSPGPPARSCADRRERRTRQVRGCQ